MSASLDISNVFKKVRALTREAILPQSIQPIAVEAALLIRKRTRLGYGARAMGGERFGLKKLSPSYVKFRLSRGAPYLSEFTAPKRSNLTFTGQMLDSIGIVRIQAGKVFIGPQGNRTDPFSKGKTNAQIAKYVAQNGRPFMYLTRPEISQLVRSYRITFGDLARRRGLT